MRSPIFQIPRQQVPAPHRKELQREAPHQLDWADLRLAAVAFVDVRDGAGLAVLRLLRRGLQHLRERSAGSQDQAVE